MRAHTWPEVLKAKKRKESAFSWSYEDFPTWGNLLPKNGAEQQEWGKRNERPF